MDDKSFNRYNFCRQFFGSFTAIGFNCRGIGNDRNTLNNRDFDFLAEQDEMIMLFRKEEKFGVVSNTKGLIIEPTFNDILNIGSLEEPVYFTEKYIPEAEFYIVIYYNSRGEILRKQVFTDEEYDKIYCN